MIHSDEESTNRRPNPRTSTPEARSKSRKRRRFPIGIKLMVITEPFWTKRSVLAKKPTTTAVQTPMTTARGVTPRASPAFVPASMRSDVTVSRRSTTPFLSRCQAPSGAPIMMKIAALTDLSRLASAIPPPHQPSPVGSASATPPQGGSNEGGGLFRAVPWESSYRVESPSWRARTNFQTSLSMLFPATIHRALS